MVEYEKLPVRTKAGLIKTVGALVPMSAETLLEKEIEMPEEIVKGLLPVGAAILAGAPSLENLSCDDIGFGGCCG